MIDVNKAWDTVKKNNPGMKVLACNETSKYYVFGLVPNDLTEGDGFANSSAYLINKVTGEYKTAHFLYVIREPILKEFDTSLFE